MRSSFAAILIAFSCFAPRLDAADIMLASGVTVAPGSSAVLPVNLASPSASGVFITLTSSDPSKVTVNRSSVYIPAGATAPWVQPQVTGVNFGNANVNASAFGLAGDTQTVRVVATLLSPTSATITRGSTQNVGFVLSAPTPSALTLTVSSDNPGVASVPPSVTIPANGSNAAVPVTGVAAGSTVIRVSAPPNLVEKTLNVTVIAPATITLPNVTAPLGQTVPFPVTLGTPAPPGGVFVTLASSQSSTVRVSPSSIFIPGGSTAPGTQPQVTGVNIGVATITASAPGYVTASQSVSVPATISFSPTSLTVAAGSTGKLVLALSESAPWGPDHDPWSAGITVQLSYSNPYVAAVPFSVDLYPDGSSFTSVVLLVRGISPGTAVIRASALPFIPETTAVVTVLP